MDNESSNPSRLGRGLSAMVNEVANIKAGSASPAPGSGFTRLPLHEIKQPHPGRQPDEALIASVKKFGLLQPVLVTRVEAGNYTLLAGSRRLGAARAAGLNDVPALLVPPEKAGALDVYLEENLARRELSESDRIRLRDRWMSETGNQLEQAEERIPEAHWESTGQKTPRDPRIWRIAAAVMAVVSSVLLILLFNAKPVDRRPVVIPVHFAEAEVERAVVEAQPVDDTWMEFFSFPGHTREIRDGRLGIIFRQPLFEDGALNGRGELALNQLAAIAQSVAVDLNIAITAPGPACSTAAAHLIGEGIAPERIQVVPDDRAPVRIDVYAVATP
jgi:hypothetical protein